MLVRRHFNIGDDHSCMLCNTEVLETNKHLFFECSFANRCWQIIGINWNLYAETQTMFDNAIRNWQKPMFKEVTMLAAWNIWKQRNKVLFDGEEASHTDWLRMQKRDLDILALRVEGDRNTFIQQLLLALVV